jgi:hypothetical protein
VEEFKLRHDTLETGELQPIRRSSSRDRDRSRRESRGVPRGVLLALVLVAILGALFLIGRGGGTDDEQGGSPVSEMPNTQGEDSAPQADQDDGSDQTARPRVVRLTLQPTSQVWVCLVAADGRRLIGGDTIGPGTRRFRSRRFTMTLGNPNVVVRAGQRRIAVPDSPGPIGLGIDARGRSRVLAEDDRPTCQ